MSLIVKKTLTFDASKDIIFDEFDYNSYTDIKD